jgi:hypothetical protein
MKKSMQRGAWMALLIMVGVVSRWLPHPPNFSAFLAIALFAGYILPSPLAMIVPIASMFLGDLLLGFHGLMWVVYLSLLPVVILGRQMPELKKQPMTWLSWGLMGLLSSVFFFITTNLAVFWSSGMYPHTQDGLVSCFVLALPFFHNSVLGTWIYLGAFEAVRQFQPVGLPALSRRQS